MATTGRAGFTSGPGVMEGTLKFFQNRIDKTSEAARSAVDAGLKMIYDRSQYYVPVSMFGSYGAAPGALKESGFYTVFGGGGSFEVNGLVSYGDTRIFYATYVHEMPYNHASPTQYRYLAQAVQDVAPELVGEIGKSFQLFFEGRSVAPEGKQ